MKHPCAKTITVLGSEMLASGAVAEFVDTKPRMIKHLLRCDTPCWFMDEDL